MASVSLISLGCPRNLVDSEVMLGLLRESGFKITEDFNKCDAAIINTCSFIEDAKKESIDLILDLIELKKEHKIKTLIVAGCLPQRYLAELKKELTDIDAFVGTGDFIKIAEVVRRALSGKAICSVSSSSNFLYDHTFARDIITPNHYVYLKLSEGCDNNCSYCVIPKIRGRLRSRGIGSVVKEAQALSKRYNISEINLIGQDITLYGTDLYGKPKLAALLKRLASLRLAKWIRILYTHPRHYTDELIGVIRDEPSICKYLDLPLQHINDRILKLMARNVKRGEIESLITRLRKEIPGLTLRTTFIVGFPGETDMEFKELYNFIEETKFERLGIFEYSKEEGTNAYKFDGQVPDKVKKERFDAIMELQQEVSKEVNAKFLGRELEILIEESEGDCFASSPSGTSLAMTRSDVIARTPEGDSSPVIAMPPQVAEAISMTGSEQAPQSPKNSYIGRTEYDAPEVDGNCFVKSRKKRKPGDFVKVKIVDTLEYDLVGEEINHI